MAYMRNTIVGISFLVLFSTLVGVIPNEYYVSESIEEYFIPTEFDAMGLIIGDAVNINHSVALNANVEYDFQAVNNLYMRHFISWDSPYHQHEGDNLKIYRKDNWYDIFEDAHVPYVIKELVESNWDVNYNRSIVKFSDGKGVVYCTFEGQPPNGQNISDAWDAGVMYVTMSYIPTQSGSQTIQGHQIVLALLSFKLPTIYENISPLLGAVLSIMVYIPIVMIVFTTGLKIVHG